MGKGNNGQLMIAQFLIVLPKERYSYAMVMGLMGWSDGAVIEYNIQSQHATYFNIVIGLAHPN